MAKYSRIPLSSLIMLVFLLLLPGPGVVAEAAGPSVKYEGLQQLDDGRWALCFLLTNTLDRDLTSITYRVTYKANGKARVIGSDTGKKTTLSQTFARGKKLRLKISLGTKHPGTISDVAFRYLSGTGKKTDIVKKKGWDYINVSYNKVKEYDDGRRALQFIITNTTKDRAIISAYYRIYYKSNGKSFVVGKSTGKTTKFSKPISPGKKHTLNLFLNPEHTGAITEVTFERLGSVSKKVAAARTQTQTASKGRQTSYSPQLGKRIAARVQKYEGVPYVWGGTTPKGFDCSGLVWYVCKELGITVPRTSKEQAKAGKYVAKKDLRPGDLVFFGRSHSGPVDHVGIYIGNDTYVHAPVVNWPVMKTRLSDNSFEKDGKTYTFEGKYVTARRVP